MLFIRILNFIKGYLVITVSGRFTERFINICIRRGFAFWDVASHGGVITAKITTDDFMKLRDVARITKVKIRIKRRCGLGFVLKRYRRRWPLVIALILFVIIMHYTATHVMSVEITGNERIPTERIAEELRDAGVKVGVRSDSIVTDIVRNDMMIKDEDISWLGVNIRGSRVYIEVAERIDSAKIPREGGEPCNVIAAKDGVIDELRVKQGQSMIRRGDGVRKGDVLISGIMDSVYGGFREVHAYGEVWAKTEYSAERDYQLKYTERTYTDNVKHFFAVDIFGRRFELFSRRNVNSSQFEERSEEYVLRRSIMGREVEVGGILHKFVGYNDEERTRTASEAVNLGKEELTREVEGMVPDDAKVVSKTAEHNIISGDTVRVTVTWYCSENIAQAAPLNTEVETQEP